MARRSFFLLFALFTTLAQGQVGETRPLGRKKVVLALAGGGAYGLMDLGALEWLERHRIPVDAIAGTSGGALVGGWYATGLELLSDDEIRNPVEPTRKEGLRLRGVREILTTIDYAHLFDSQPDYRNLSMLQKRERRLYPNDFFAEVSSSRTLRRDGLVPGQKIGFFLDWIGRDYPADFDRLPTPFRAVTVDAAASNPGDWRTLTLGGPNPEVALGLSRAIRASIAVPVLFAPVDVGRYRLIDGAVRDNLPTDVAIDAFDPDVLIALRWDSGYGPDAYRAGGRGDARDRTVVTFDPRPYHVDQFGKWQELAWIGYRGMEARRTELLRHALPLDEYLAYRAKRRARSSARSRSHVVTRIEGEGRLDGVRRAALGKNLDVLKVTEALGRALDRKVADEGLATAGYDLLDGGVLRVRTTRHKGGTSFLRGGLETEVASDDRPYPGLRGRISDLRADQTRYWIDGKLGTEPAFSGGLDIPLRRGLSLSPTFRFDRETEFRFAGDRRASEAAIFGSEATLGLFYRPSRSVEFGFGGFTGANDVDDQSGRAFDPETRAYRGLFARAELDTRDDAVAPREGSWALLEGRGYGGAFAQTWGALDLYREGLGLHASFGTSLGSDAPFPFEFRPRLDAYRRDEVRGDGFAALAFSQTRPLAPLPFAFGRLFLQPRLEGAWASGRFYPGASLSLLGDTRAGAFRLGVGIADGGVGRAFLELGRRF